MSLQLQPDQLIAALQRLDHPLFPSFLDQLLSLSDAMAEAVAEAIPNVYVTTPANFWDEMVCVALAPWDDREEIPEALQGFDDEGWE